MLIYNLLIYTSIVDDLVAPERLKARLRGRKLCFTDDERRRLAVKGKELGRKRVSCA